MRDDVPSPAELKGAQVWTEATFSLAGREHSCVVSAGNMVWQADQEITRVTGLVIPAKPAGVDVIGAGLVGSDGHRVRLTGHAATARRLWVWPIGTFHSAKTSPDGPKITCELESLNSLVTEHQNVTPVGVGKASRISWVVGGILAEDHIDLLVDEDLEEQTVPTDFTIGTDRAAALKELMTAWGAQLVPDPSGAMRAMKLETDPITAVAVTFSGDETMIDAPMELTRDGVFNHIVIDLKDEVGVAQATQTEGQYGVERFGWRTKRVQSDAIVSAAQGTLVAKTELAKALRRTITVPVETLPDWRIEPFEAVGVTTDKTRWGRVTGIDRPLVGGSMVFHVGMEV